jgi:hypothetical protein
VVMVLGNRRVGESMKDKETKWKERVKEGGKKRRDKYSSGRTTARNKQDNNNKVVMLQAGTRLLRRPRGEEKKTSRSGERLDFYFDWKGILRVPLPYRDVLRWFANRACVEGGG